MIRARIAASLALAALCAVACGQKGDLKLPAAKTQPGTAAQPAPTQPPPAASTPAPPSHK